MENEKELEIELQDEEALEIALDNEQDLSVEFKEEVVEVVTDRKSVV